MRHFAVLQREKKTNDGRDALKFIEPLLNKQPMELSVQHSRTLRVTHSNLKIWDKPKGEKSRTRLKIVVIRLYEGAQIRLSFFSRKRRISAQSFLNPKSIFKNTCITSRQQIYNTRPINERARGHTKNFVMTLTDFSRREKSSRESMQGEKGALCWVICSCMKHFTAKPEHYKCLLQIPHRLYTCVLSNTYMLVSKFRDTAPILGERNIL